MKITLLIALVIAPVLIKAQEHIVTQSKTQLTIGLSWTDAVNIGTRYRFGQSQVGLNLGTVFPHTPGYRFITLASSYYRHLWGKSKWSDLKPWYAKLGITAQYFSMRDHADFADQQGRQYLSKLHIGRDFNFNRRSGITISAGPWASLHWKSKRRVVDTDGFSFIKSPSFDFSFYYRLK